MVNRKILLSVTVIVMLTLSAGIVWADEVTSMINYQGQLAGSAGGPLSGTYEMTFRLYDVSSGGTALDTDTHLVEVENGLFNTEINFDQSYFDGRALWLGITVGADSEMMPRQELRPVPYALSLVPGAMINGSLSGHVLQVNTDGADSYGVYAYTTGGDSEGFYAYTTGKDSEGFYAETYGDYSEGVNARTYGDGSEGVWAKTTGKDSPAVYGYSEQDVGVYGKGKEGGYFEAPGSSGKGVYGEASNTGDVRNYGGYFTAAGSRGRGVYGKASNIGDFINYGGFFYASGVQGRGVFGQSNGSSGYGVKGWASNEGDVENYGGHFTATGSRGIGVYGCAENGGDGKNYGGYFVADGSKGTGVYGEHNPTGNLGILGNEWYGVYGVADEGKAAVYGRSYGDDTTTGILGGKSTGVYGETTAESGTAVIGIAVYAGPGMARGQHGGYFAAMGPEGTGIYAMGGPSGSAAVFVGDVIISGGRTIAPVLEITGGSDLSEQFEIRGIEAEVSPSPGMVVSIGTEHPGELVVSNNAYDRRVAGIISGAGGLNPGMLMGQNGSEADGGYPVALSGRVYCNVDATEAGVEPGDLLTTSVTPGYAMKVTDYERAQGAILGKAMERLEEGEKGQILVLVTLQ